MGVLDILNGCTDIDVFLDNESNLGDDLLALKRASVSWSSKDPINVGESGTLYRLLQFASWKRGLNKKFILSGTLLERTIANDPNIIKLSQKELLTLDNNTSQWATAAALLGDTERITNPPYKLQLTYEAIDHWNAQRKKSESWIPKRDETIFHQAEIFLELLKGEAPLFIPQQAEDYCFARVFNFVTKKYGESKWPSLKGHESNRINEMETTITVAERGESIFSKDHRVIQSLAMWGEINKKKLTIVSPESVNKSWPQFWDFIEWSRNTITP